MAKVRIIRDTSTDVMVHVTGAIQDAEFGEVILRACDLGGKPPALRLVNLFHAIQDGLSLELFWHREGEEHELILPVEGRGFLNLEAWCQGIQDPSHAARTGQVYLSYDVFKPGLKHFMLALEFTKLRE